MTREQPQPTAPQVRYRGEVWEVEHQTGDAVRLRRWSGRCWLVTSVPVAWLERSMEETPPRRKRKVWHAHRCVQCLQPLATCYARKHSSIYARYCKACQPE